MRELISAARIQDRVDELATEINEDFEGVDLLLMIIILRGGSFFGTDLAKRLSMPVRLDYIRVASYAGTESTGVVSMVSDVKTDIRGKPVLVVDDIVDTGFTMQWILRFLDLKHPGQVRVTALLDKPSRREFDVHIDYLGFTIPNVFVAGYGLDGLDDTMANIPRVVAIEDIGELDEMEVSVPPRRTRLPILGN